MLPLPSLVQSVACLAKKLQSANDDLIQQEVQFKERFEKQDVFFKEEFEKQAEAFRKEREVLKGEMKDATSMLNQKLINKRREWDAERTKLEQAR